MEICHHRCDSRGDAVAEHTILKVVYKLRSSFSFIIIVVVIKQCRRCYSSAHIAKKVRRDQGADVNLACVPCHTANVHVPDRYDIVSEIRLTDVYLIVLTRRSLSTQDILF